MIFPIRAILKRMLLLVGLVLFITTAQAQPDPGDDPDVPIDSGIGILIATGIALGAKKIHEHKKLTEKSEN